MRAIAFAGATHRYGAPPDWDEEKHGPCDILPVMHTKDGRMVSVWEPSEVDLTKLNAGGAVALHIVGNIQPPVALTVVRLEAPTPQENES